MPPETIQRVTLLPACERTASTRSATIETTDARTARIGLLTEEITAGRVRLVVEAGDPATRDENGDPARFLTLARTPWCDARSYVEVLLGWWPETFDVPLAMTDAGPPWRPVITEARRVRLAGRVAARVPLPTHWRVVLEQDGDRAVHRSCVEAELLP